MIGLFMNQISNILNISIEISNKSLHNSCQAVYSYILKALGVGVGGIRLSNLWSTTETELIQIQVFINYTPVLYLIGWNLSIIYKLIRPQTFQIK